jgi:predicted metal-dependent HD superfamily phosphohydrolase
MNYTNSNEVEKLERILRDLLKRTTFKLNLNWSSFIFDYNVDYILAILIARYQNPRRFYHNLSHVHHVLDNCEMLLPDTRESIELVWAVIFHDAVLQYGLRDPFNPHETDEVKSSKLLRTVFVRCGFLPDGEDILVEAQRIIEGRSESHLQEVFTRADYSILADPRKYGEYSAQIEMEYTFNERGNLDAISREEFLQGRLNFLSRTTELLQTRNLFESRLPVALRNIRTEMDQLERELSYEKKLKQTKSTVQVR